MASVRALQSNSLAFLRSCFVRLRHHFCHVQFDPLLFVLFCTTPAIGAQAAAHQGSEKNPCAQHLGEELKLPSFLAYIHALNPAMPEGEIPFGLKSSQFIVKRNWVNYTNKFAPHLRDDLLALGHGQRWFNSGAGNAVAEKEYLSKSNHSEVVSLVYQRDASLLDSDLPHSPRFHFMEGRFLEEVSNFELGKFDVITDYYGPIAYTRDFTKVLQKYLDLITEDGVIYFALESEASNTQYVVENGEAVTLRNWIEGIPGIVVEAERTGQEDVFRIKKVAPGPVHIPPLLSIYYSYSEPPSRTFRTP
jgi:hypothetical protein